MEVVVEYEYEALHEDELTLRPGDVIKNVRYIEEDGWMEGELSGKRGLFPDNFVKEVKKDSKEVKETKNEPKEEAAQPVRREKSGNVANLVQRISTIGIPTGGFQPPPPPQTKKPKKRLCKAQFEYQPQNEDELELKIGDLIEITEEVEEGWWSGAANGRSGLFPSNFVRELEAGEETESPDSPADDTDGSATEAGAATPSSPPPGPGNGVIAQPKKIRGIGFGDIFKEGSVKLKPRLPSPEKDDRKDKPAPSLPSAPKPAPPSTDAQRTDGDKARDANVSVPSAREYCKVTFAFDATHEDELTIKDGDVIHLLSKETGEPGWWRGEIGGRDGVFPNNFVTLISEAEKEAPVSRGSLKSPKQESEEKPRKPPPPSKSSAPRPEVPSSERKPQLSRTEDRVSVEKPSPDHKPSKPAAPLVPPKKPIPPPGKGRQGSLPPKKPDKPLTPSPNLRHNGEMPSARPKSEFELYLSSKPRTQTGNGAEKTTDAGDLMSFDELSSSSEKLSHPTANRPKMPGRRLPAHFGGNSPNKDVSIEKSFELEEEEPAKPKPTETRKPSSNALSKSPSLQRPQEARPSPAVTPGTPGTPGSDPSVARLEPEEPGSQLEELRSQMRDLLLSVELLKAQQTKEMADLRGELDEERLKRVALQVEIEKLKAAVHST